MAAAAAKAAAPQITVFSLQDCPHCKKAKALLAESDLPFEDISLTDYPEKRTDMLQLANRLTVPQIFVQGRHVGGAAELSRLHETRELLKLLQAPLGDFAQDPRLLRPTYPPKPVAPLPKPPPERQFCFGAVSLEYPQVVKMLMDNLPLRIRSSFLGSKDAKPSCSGKDLVEFLMRHFAQDRADAVRAAETLLSAGICINADGTQTFSDKSSLRLQANEPGFKIALNMSRIWTALESDPSSCSSEAVAAMATATATTTTTAVPAFEPQPQSEPLGVLKRLKGQLGKLLQKHADDYGSIDYVAVAEDPDFLMYELATAELQSVKVSSMNINARKAFLINLYNTLVPHAFAKVGIGSSDLSRSAFFDSVSVVLESFLEAPLSLNALENGLLRGNRTPPFHLRRPLSASSPFYQWILQCDYRIHFALNCGAKSCPPVKWFSSEAIDEELRVVAMAWVEQDDNVKVDLATSTLWLSQICDWYAMDFGENKVQIGTTLLAHCHGEKQEQLQSLLKSDFQLKHLKYDWSTNSRRSKTLSANITGLMGLVGC